MDLYNIESDHNYLSNIDTCKISSYSPDGIINMSYSTLSNLNSVVSCNIDTNILTTSNLSVQNMVVVDSYIQNLEVSSFSTVGLSVSSSVFGIESDRLIVYGQTIIVKKDNDALPDYVNETTDRLIIKTDPTIPDANGYCIYGNNKSIKLVCKNDSTLVNSYVSQELKNKTGGFAFVSKLTSDEESLPELYITPITGGVENPYPNPAVTMYYDKSILLKGELFLQLDTAYITSAVGFTKKSVNIGNGLLVFSSTLADTSKYPCLTTNKYGSLDTGRGISEGKGPFNKQGGWQTVGPDGIYIISNEDYGVTDYTAGTIFIQVQQKNPAKIGNASLSFLRFSEKPDMFNVSSHKSSSLNELLITAHDDGIQVQTDVGCKVCWTSIGSC